MSCGTYDRIHVFSVLIGTVGGAPLKNVEPLQPRKKLTSTNDHKHIRFTSMENGMRETRACTFFFAAMASAETRRPSGPIIT